MADKVITGGVSNASELKVDNLAPNNYLTLVWNNTDTKTKVQTLSVDLDRYNQMNNKLTNSTQNVLQSGLYKIINNKYINLGSVAKYFAQTTFDSYGARQAVNGLVNVLQDGAIQNDDVLNALLYYSGDILGDVAREYGVSDINLVVQQLAGQNILNNFNGLDFLDKFCNATQNWTNKSEASLNERMITLPYSQDVVSGEYTGILLGITESDTHSLDIEIPRKRVESGYNYTSHVIVNPFKKDLKLKLTNKVLTSEYNQETEVDNIEAVRDLIESIANSKMRFDIYVRLSNRKYKSYTGLMFSSLSFDKSAETGMSYDFTCTIEPVDEYIPKTYIFTPPVSSCPVGGNRSTSSNASNTNQGQTNPPQQPQQPQLPASASQAKLKFEKATGTKGINFSDPNSYSELYRKTLSYFGHSKRKDYLTIFNKLRNGQKLNRIEQDTVDTVNYDYAAGMKASILGKIKYNALSIFSTGKILIGQ